MYKLCNWHTNLFGKQGIFRNFKFESAISSCLSILIALIVTKQTISAYLKPICLLPQWLLLAGQTWNIFLTSHLKTNDHTDIFPDSLKVYAQFGNLKSIFEKYTYILGGSSYFVYVCGFVNCLCPFFTRVQCVKTDRQLFSEQALYSPGSNRQKGRKDKTFTKIGWKKK